MKKYILTIRFILFLIKTGNCKRFIRNYRNYWSGTRHFLWFIVNYMKRNPKMVVFQAFYWEDTPEGHEYWEEVHKEWKRVFSRFKTT